MDYIQNMIDIRRENHDRQEDLAKKTGWSRIQIARYETRKSTPTIDYLQAFCTVYKVSADRVLEIPKEYK